MSKTLNLLIFFFCLIPWGFGQSFTVRHDHDPWGSCQGELTVHGDGIDFRSSKEDHNRQWAWTDIQAVDRFSPLKFTILTYTDQKLLAGRDQPFDFTVLEGEGLNDETFQIIQEHSIRPLVDRSVEMAVSIEYEIPVKHLHTFGGCEGVLQFTSGQILYVTKHQKDSRKWRIGKEIAGIWSANRFDLEIQAFEREDGDYHQTRSFRFQLKQPLDNHYYRKLRREIHLPELSD